MTHRWAILGAAALLGAGLMSVEVIVPGTGATAAAQTQPTTSPVTDFSAQKKFKGKGAGGGAARRGGGGGDVGKKSFRRIAPRDVGPRVGAGRVGPRVGIGGVRGGALRFGGRRFGIIRGPRSFVWRGRRRNLVPIFALGALGLLTVGGIAYAAYGYVPIDDPQYCSGPTEDGCYLRWAEVPTAEGDFVPQCLAYCPR